MSVSTVSASGPDLVQLVMLKRQLSAEATQTAQLLEGLRTQPATAPARPTPPPGTSYL